MRQFGFVGAALALGLTACGAEPGAAARQGAVARQDLAAQPGAAMPQAGATQPGAAIQPAAASRRDAGGEQGDAQRALQGLMQIRQQQCQSGNGLACQSLPEFPRHHQRLTQTGQACRAGSEQACASYRDLSQSIFKAYAESAAVMRQGAQSMARMDAWRSQMNANHADNMARLNVQAAAGQAAHNARQQTYDTMNQTWANGQAAAERNTGRFNDAIYEGTTMSGGGVRTFVPHGSTAYTDGAGNVAVGAEGGEAPAGWTPMAPTYAPPD